MKKRRNTIITVLVLFTLIFLGYIHSSEIPADTASQSTDDSDTSEDGLPPLEDNLKAFYQDAETIYFQIIFGDFNCDTNTSIEKDNYTYYKVTDPNFDSYDSFKTYLLNYFSEDLIDEKLLKPVDTRFIEGEDGTLYMMILVIAQIFFMLVMFFILPREVNIKSPLPLLLIIQTNKKAMWAKPFLQNPKISMIFQPKTLPFLW